MSMAKETDPKLLSEQLAYYNARAREYDETARPSETADEPGDPAVGGEWQHLVDVVHAVPHAHKVLELACGTGIWTQELLDVADSIVALDGAHEMLEVNRSKLGSSKVHYQQADLFNWKANATYDLVFFAFWLSHVPNDLLDGFLTEAARAVKPGGRLFIIDEPAGGKNISGPAEANAEQTRSLLDGSSFRIVKVYHDVDVLAQNVRGLGFSELDLWLGDYFFYLNAVRNA